MADLHFKIRADVSELEKAYKTINDFEKKIANINKTLGEVQPGGKKFKELAKELTELEKQYEKSIKRISELENVVNNLNESQKLVTITKEVTASANEATQVFVKYAGSLEELDRRVKELTKEYLSMNAAQKASSQGQGVINEISILNSQRKIEADSLRALQKEYVNTQRMQDLQEGSITALRTQLSQLTATYDNMGRSMRNSASGKELVGSIQLVTTELNEAEQASMRFNRNVGNYASGWNGLNMQVQQVARELPAMAMGANTFFLAISNNLPMLADEIKKAKTEYKAFVAEGKNATPVWKQVASSLFSWQTALVAGVTILSMYGKDIWNWVKSLISAEEQLEKLASAEEQLADSRRKGFNDSVREKTELELLYKASQDHRRSLEERKAAVDKLQSLFPVYFGNLKDEKILAGEAAGAYNQLTAQILATANARAITNKIGENSTKIFDLRGELSMGLAVLRQLGDARIKANEEYDRKAKEGFGTATAKIDAKYAISQADLEFKQQEKFVNAIIAQREKLKKVNESLSQEVNVKDLTVDANSSVKEPTQKTYFDSYAQTKEIEKASQSVKDTVLKSETDILQSQIDLMDEGSNKQLAQIRLNYEKRFAEIQKREREALQLLQGEERKQWEKKNPDYKKKNLQFTPTITKLPEEVQGKFGTQYSLAYQQQEKDANNLLKNLLDKYQDYATQRLAIEKKFNDDIATLEEQRKLALKNGDTQQVEEIDRAKAQATKNKGMELMSMDYDKLKESPEYVRAFENLKETSSETLNSLLSQLENAKGAAAKVLSPDQLREYTTTIQEIMDELDSRNPFQALADRKKELAEAEEELAEAKRNLDTVNSGGKVASGTKLNEKTGKIDTTYLSSTQALEKYNKAKDKSVKADARVKKAEKEVTDVVGELSKSIKEVGDAIGGSAGEIISLIGDIGLFAMTAMSGVSTASTTASKSIQAVEKASVILAIIGAAIQIAMKIASLFKDDDGVAAYEKAKDVYESYIDILDRVIEKQKELFELNSKTGEQAYEKAKETVKKQENASRELGKQYLNSGASKGFLGIGSSASEGVKQRDDMSSNALDEAKKVLGRDYNKATDGRMTGLFDMSAKQLADLQRDAPLFWAELHDDTQKYLQQIIDCNEELTKLEQDRMEGLVKTDFSSFSDSFLDMLTDLDSSSQDFADNFEKYLQNAILTSLITDKYKSNIEALYKQWADDTESGNKLTEDEAIALRKKQEELANSMLEERNQLMKDFGWTSGESSSQDSTKGGFATASQDSISELNGRFTAGQIAWEETKNQAIEQTSLLSSINEKMSLVGVEEGSTSAENESAGISPSDGLREMLAANYTQRDNHSSLLIGQITVLTNEVVGLKGIVDEMRTKQVEQMIDVSDIADGASVIIKNIPTFLANSEATKNSCKSLAGR